MKTVLHPWLIHCRWLALPAMLAFPSCATDRAFVDVGNLPAALEPQYLPPPDPPRFRSLDRLNSEPLSHPVADPLPAYALASGPATPPPPLSDHAVAASSISTLP